MRSPGRTRLSTIVCIPPLPVALTGNAVRFCVRKVARSSSATASMTSPNAGSRWPGVGCASASSTRCGTGEGPEPRRSRSGKAAKHAKQRARSPRRARSGRLHVREVLGEMLAQHVADPAALVLRRDAEAHEQGLLALARHAGDGPANGQALEEELHRALPGVLLLQPAVEERGVPLARLGGH